MNALARLPSNVLGEKNSCRTPSCLEDFATPSSMIRRGEPGDADEKVMSCSLTLMPAGQSARRLGHGLLDSNDHHKY